MQNKVLIYQSSCIKHIKSDKGLSPIKYYKINQKPTLYLLVSNLSFIFANKWHSICITNKYKTVMPQSQKYGGNREQITNKQRL